MYWCRKNSRYNYYLVKIIEKTNASRSLICSIAKKNNLKTNKADINQELNLTYEEEQVLIGGLLGDSYITISKKSK